MIHVMLPTQYLRQAGRRLVEPQKRLMLAVLQTVVHDCGGPSCVGPDRQGAPPDSKAAQEAAAYVASTDRSWPFSFENLCEAIGIDPDRLRRGLRVTPSPADDFAPLRKRA